MPKRHRTAEPPGGQTTIPAALAEFIAQHAAQHPRPNPQPVTSAEVRVGDLRHVRPTHGGPSRLALVVSRTFPGAAEVTLVHPYAEIATDCDLVIPRGLLDVPYDLVIQSDLIGHVWRSDLGVNISHVPASVVEWYFTRVPPADMPPAHVGHALAGSLDARWAFKVHEGDEIEALSANCTAALLKRWA